VNIDRAAEVIAWTIRARCVRYGIAFIPVDTLDINGLAQEIAANLRDPPVQFRDLIVDMRQEADITADTGDRYVTPEEMGNPDWYAHPESPNTGGDQ
jgi:hypothetical protein